MEHGERGGGLARESVSQVEALEHLVREAARDPRGERAGRHLLLEGPWRDRIDADRRGTGRGEGEARPQQHGPYASPGAGEGPAPGRSRSGRPGADGARASLRSSAKVRTGAVSAPAQWPPGLCHRTRRPRPLQRQRCSPAARAASGRVPWAAAPPVQETSVAVAAFRRSPLAPWRWLAPLGPESGSRRVPDGTPRRSPRQGHREGRRRPLFRARIYLIARALLIFDPWRPDRPSAPSGQR